MSCYLDTLKKEECFGCEGCKQICPKDAIEIIEDEERFRYPVVNEKKCIHCGLCRKSCSYNIPIDRYSEKKYAFGGYHKDENIRDKSTSGGFFTAIVDNWCDKNYVIFGATANGLDVYHTYIEDKKKLELFRKSKYSQSRIGDSYIKVKRFLQEGRKVLFSGTPCQISGLKAFLQKDLYPNLLTVEVICEGVPSPLYMKKYAQYMEEKYKSKIRVLDYRYTKKKWDFQVMYTELQDRKKVY